MRNMFINPKVYFFSSLDEIMHNKFHLHPEKCFVEETKIWLAQQSFSFKYGPMEILFELPPSPQKKKKMLIFLSIRTKKFCIGSKKHGVAN